MIQLTREDATNSAEKKFLKSNLSLISTLIFSLFQLTNISCFLFKYFLSMVIYFLHENGIGTFNMFRGVFIFRSMIVREPLERFLYSFNFFIFRIENSYSYLCRFLSVYFYMYHSVFFSCCCDFLLPFLLSTITGDFWPFVAGNTLSRETWFLEVCLLDSFSPHH